MSKLAGIRGRSPETYPSARNSGNTKTQSGVNPDSVPLGTALASLLTGGAALDVAASSIVTFTGVVVLTSGASVLVTVAVVVDNVVAYNIGIEVTSINSPVPFSLTYEADGLESGSTVDVQAQASLASTATVMANSSVVVVSV